MKIISKMLVGALALAVTNVYAAELMTKAEFQPVMKCRPQMRKKI